MSRLPDPWQAGLAAGWQVQDGAALQRDVMLECDVAIVGSGAGGGMAAELLAQAGLRVLLLEEGALHSSQDFRLNEAEAYPQLYQESANRQTADKAITILQGRSVGGSTTVNWTSSFRTPAETLAWWRQRHGLGELEDAALAPWFQRAEERLGIAPWQTEPNANNSVLERGCQALGLRHARMRRNVRGCWNLGYCGTGCATNAKQSMLVTTIPAALAAGARLFSRVRVRHLLLEGDKVAGVLADALQADGVHASGVTLTVRARQVVLSAGAIGTPAVLLRSHAPDPYHQLGRRTFLHPVLLSGAIFAERIEGYYGAPQSVYSDHFLHTGAIDGPLGYKLEVPPIHPLIMAATLPGLGVAHQRLMQQMPHLNVVLALLRDGFHPRSQGGTVRLRTDGSPQLDYPLGEVEWEAARRALLTMAEVQFAAGARAVLPVHEDAGLARSWRQARQMIAELPMQALRTRVVSAHVMGGAAMAASERDGVVDQLGRHWQLANLTIIDGSLFPSSVGANPQLSVYAFALRAADALHRRMQAA
ncbi:GMC family oxidoreductase [Vogesella sp. LIG4]|uniref:GMC family oxidoreductase n=1 Tax=Vogesella sp. LIG4 TaxID=1192162 RepID=UPI00081FF73E|nr:GMC family oxidoreductase [Vogesella sp. LIG4]SCK27727.1 Choline dehydrogenase [Vogesella sp. LIG4]